MADVVEVEFGKAEREHVRRFARLMGLLEAYEADIIADPIKHIRMAGAKITLLRRQIEDARDAERRARKVEMYSRSEPIPSAGFSDMVRVPKRDWEALQAMRAIIFSDEYETGK